MFAAIAVTLCELLPNKGAAADAVASSAAVSAAPADDELTRLRTSKKSTQHIYEGCLKEKEAAWEKACWAVKNVTYSTKEKLFIKEVFFEAR